MADVSEKKSSGSGAGSGRKGWLGRQVWLCRAGSLKVTLALFVALAVLVLAYYFSANGNPLLLATPLALLAGNLLAALITNCKFRHQLPLLAFHLSLLALLLLVAAGRLAFLEGEAEITVGEVFSGQPSAVRAGPLHRWELDNAKFRLIDFSIQYEPDRGSISRGATESRVSWINSNGEVMQGIMGDHLPLILHGYRIYTTSNKGFAPLFLWQPREGVPQRGSIHLPSWPAHEHNQALDWVLPGTEHRLWVQLQFDEVILDPTRSSSFRTPKVHTLVVRAGEERYVLTPGESIHLPDGRLTYEGLSRWMGFRITADGTLPWLIAAALFAAVSLGWHYWRRYSATPWSDGERPL